MNKALSGLIALAIGLVLTGPAFSQTLPPGNPDYPGRLVFVYSDDHAVAQVDGEYLTDVTDGKAVKDLDPGTHELKIYLRKGLFDLTLKQETTLEILGGCITRATIRKDQLAVLDVKAIPGQEPVAAPAPAPAPAAAPAPAPTASTTTVTASQMTVLGVNGLSVQITTTQTLPGAPEPAPSVAPTPAPAPGPAARVANRPSRIEFTSDAGQCEVYLDGKPVADLGVSMIDEPASATVTGLKASTYRVKVVSFNKTWYDDKLTVGSGEVLKIHVEPQLFDVVSRDPL